VSAETGDATLVRFLLEDLPDVERAQVEDRFFADDELFARLLAVEGELIEDYLGGGLNEADRRRFEAVFLASPDRRRRFQVSQRLLQSLEREDQERPDPAAPAPRAGSGPRPMAIAAAVALVLLGLVAADDLRLRRARSRTQQELAAAQEQARDMQRQLAALRPPGPGHDVPPPEPTAPQLLALNLTAERAREPGAGTDVRIDPGVSALRATLEPPAVRYPAYRAYLRTAEGRVVWRGSPQAGRGSQDDALIVIVPADQLLPGDYLLVLEGVPAGGRVEAAAEYFLRVLPPASR
jgi:hypothetical protein